VESKDWPPYLEYMTLKELQSALRAILEAERADRVDWVEVQALCRRTRDRLQQESPPDYTDEFVYVFLDDARLRQEDEDYAQVQRERLANWLDGSEIISR
jgi:hypothetical protein